LPGFEFNLWTGMLGPAKMPRDVKEKIAKEVAHVVTLRE